MAIVLAQCGDPAEKAKTPQVPNKHGTAIHLTAAWPDLAGISLVPTGRLQGQIQRGSFTATKLPQAALCINIAKGIHDGYHGTMLTFREAKHRSG